MRQEVVEIGPGTVRGSRCVPQRLVATALESLDDDITLFEDQPVAVAAVWREVFRAVLPEDAQTAALVCPTWWPPPRIECVREAASIVSADVVVLQRAQVLAEHADGNPTVVEIGQDLSVVWRDGNVVAAKPRIGGHVDDARSVIDEIGSATAVLVDAPIGVPGAVELATAIAAGLRADGVAATTVHPDRVLASPPPAPAPPTRVPDPAARKLSQTLVLAAVLSVALLCVGLCADTDAEGYPAAETPMTLLVEGQVALKVPALWAVQRITAGPGSARVQVSAADSSVAVLVTQSRLREGETLTAAAAALRSALDDEKGGVFGDFNPGDRRADRPAATYRERRGGRQIDWSVLVDGAVRIGIGCQSPIGEEHLVRDACEEAIRSAHAIF